MPSSRPGRYCLGLQNDSVFADFDLDNERRVFLIRISFDGFGCYGTAEEAKAMSPDISSRFINLVESNDVASGELARILSQYLRQNQDIISRKPLIDHNLLQNYD